MKSRTTFNAIFIATISFALMQMKTNAQSFDWTWSRNAVAGAGINQQNAITVDNNGNTIATGYFNSATMTFGTTTLTNPGAGNDMFIVKYDVNGNVLWAKNGNANGNNYGLGISTDASGNIYLSGYFNTATMTFGSYVLNNSGSSSGFGNSYLVKYDANGNVIWAMSVAGSMSSNGIGGICAVSNAVYAIGTFQASSITFGSSTMTNANAPYQSPFIVKYNQGSGGVSWARNPTGNTNNDAAMAVSADNSGNVYVAGYFTSSSITFGSTKLTNNGTAGTHDIFIVKYDTAGNLVWAKSAGGTGDDYSYSVSVDGLDNVYISGYFKSSNITFGTTTLTNSASPYGDSYIVKYDAGGNLLWAKNVTTSGSSNGMGCVYATPTGAYGVGTFQAPTITFGSVTLTNANAPSQAPFIVKYDVSGNVVWANSPVFSSGGSGLPQSVAADVKGNVSMTGYFTSSTITFGTNTPLSNPSPGSNDIFVARLYDTTATLGVAEITDKNSISVYPNPFNNSATLQIHGMQIQPGKTEFVLYDVFGRKVRESEMHNSTYVIEKGELPCGIYFYHVQSLKGIIGSGKLIIQ